MRVVLEGVARAAALLTLLSLLVQALLPVEAPGPVEVSSEELGGTLRVATMEGRTAGAIVRMGSLPAPEARDWLGALRAAGSPVWWSAEHVQAAAVSAEPLVDPRGGVEIKVWRGGHQPAVIFDGAGELARLDPGEGSSVLTVRGIVRDVSVQLPGQRAVTGAPDSVRFRDVLVVGSAGWESRFLLRTLEELGWNAHARLAVAPGVSVVQGAPAAPDTGRYAAVIVLDSAAVPLAAALGRYVRGGGGLVLAGESSRIGAFAAIAPGQPGRRQGGSDDVLPEDAPRLGLTLHPVQSPAPEAVVLQRHGEHSAVAARRVGAGRVVQAGYDDSWRLRMEGGEAGPEDHRQWWARVLAATAYAPPSSAPSGDRAGDPAPLASMADALGLPSAPPESPPGRRRLPVLPLFLGALSLLLAEWGSRRLRGAP